MAQLNKSGSTKMRPRARLIGLIGDELISDEPVAVVELVKNSYDADAKEVTVKFEGQNPLCPDRIVVEDDGIGMDLDTVLTGWFEPGTIMKRKNEVSPGGRPYQGAKGIGRFAAARLAENLILESRREVDSEGTFVLLEWGKFDDESYLDEISIDYEVRPLNDIKHGTRLTLETLRKIWYENDYKELHARLSRLISPFQDVIDFQIILQIPGFPENSGIVEPPELILKPRYMLSGVLDDNGYFTGKILVDGDIYREINSRKLDSTDAKPIFGSMEVEIRGWDRDREGLEPIMDRHSMGINQIRTTLDAYCGVSIYRDGFRVYPYGQKGNDWLNLDLRSRQNPVKNMANNQIVAAIKISREKNPGLKDRSTREGMVHNAEHTALEDWFIEVLSILEEERYDIRPRQVKSYSSDELFEPFEMEPVVERVSKELGSGHPITRLLEDTEKQVKKGIERVQEVYSRLLMSAGLGHMVDIVIHEIGSPLGKINRQLVLLEKELSFNINKELWDYIEPMFQSIESWLEQIHNLRQRLEPQTPAKRGRTTSFDVIEEVEDNFEFYKTLIEKQKITWSIKSSSSPVRVKMARSVLGQIVANLIDNSIYWITKKYGEGKGGEIQVRIDTLENGFSLLFSDTGPGVSDEYKTKIFEPYFTKKANGMGLGLYIARLVIEPYGKLQYKSDGPLSGACFEAIFEQRVGR